MQQTRLGLTIPKQNQVDSKIDVSVTAIEKWLSQVPTADLNEAATTFLSKFKEINVIAMDPDLRFKILETLNPLCLLIYQSLRKNYINQNQILSEKKLTIVELSRDLLNEILTSYKIIIENIYSSLNVNIKNTVLSNTIYLVFKWYNNLLFTYYELYERAPVAIYKEMHIIYSYALNCQITEELISSKLSLETTKNSTLATQYKYALFLMASNPYQWKQNEQELLYKSAILWEEFIIIRNCKTTDRQEISGVFLIPMQEQLSLLPIPVAITLNKINFNDKELILDLSTLITHLKTLLSSAKTNNSSELILTTYGITKLMNYLTEGQVRKLERFNIIGDVSVAFGFVATHYYINQKRHFKPDNLTSGNSNQNDAQELQLGADTDLVEEASPQTLSLEEKAATDDSIEQEYKSNSSLYKCSLTNIQGEGAGVTFQQDTLFPPIQPGEIVAMAINATNKLDLDETHWNIGIVRWLQHDYQKKLMAGIKILAPSVTAAAVQLIKNDATVGYFQRAFLFKNNDNKENTFTIITPILQFEVGKKVKIFSFYFNDTFETTLKEQLDITNNFKCFIVELAVKNKSP